MDMRQSILRVLRELAQDDYNEFKWYLENPEQVNGLKGIPKSQLESTGVVRTGTTDLIMQQYHGNQTEIMVDVLKKIERHDLVESFLKGLSSKKESKVKKEKHPSGSELQSTSTSTGAAGTKDEEEFRKICTSMYSTAFSVVGAAKGGPSGARQGRRIGEAIGPKISNTIVDVVRMFEDKCKSDDDDD